MWSAGRSVIAAVVLVLLVALAAPAHAQSIFGKYTMKSQQGDPLTLILQPAGSGKVKGSLSRTGVNFPLEGKLDGDDATGLMKGDNGNVYFEATREGDQLRLILVEMGPNGQPNYAAGRELTFDRADASASTTAEMANAPEAASANPLARAAADRLVGTYTSAEITLVVKKNGDAYAGTIQYSGQDMPFSANAAGSTLSGAFNSGGQAFDFKLQLAGDGNYANLSTGGTTYMLARKQAGNPLAGSAGGAAPPTNPPNPTGAGGAAGSGGSGTASAQDDQARQFLMANAWCSFSYSGSTSTNGGTSYGRTSTSRVVFGPNGVVQRTSGSENTNSGSAGSVYGSSSGGETGRWKVENTQLYISADGVQWQMVKTEVSRNSNGYPILKADGIEYMVCR